ncbi:MAG: methyltransferase [Alphaproteobacteria bacterium]|nr:methyltransferase [Alphaproteobacteria bacterium]
MKELLKSNDPVLLSWAEALLAGEGIETYVLDRHMSVLEGSAAAIPRRLMVDDEYFDRARAVIDRAREELSRGDSGSDSGAQAPRGRAPATVPTIPRDLVPEVTEDGFLGGQVRLRQPAKGYRAAIDPVFLAAAVPAVAGERALDMGAGVGTAALLLAWRVAGLRVTGVEIEPALLKLASENARLNHLADRVEFMIGDLSRPPSRLVPGSFNHVLANPPYLEPGRADASPDAGRAGARVEGIAGARVEGIAGARKDAGRPGTGLEAWVRFGCIMARDGGTITMIHRADRLDDLLSVLRGRAGGITVFPLWPDRTDRPAVRVLVQAVKGSRAPMRLAQGLVLHEDGGGYTVEADAVLRHGAPVPIQGRGAAS